jgi:hypothetical protein
MPIVNMKVLGRFRCPYCNANVNLGVIAATPSMVHEGDACARFNASSFTQTVADTLKAIPVTRGSIPDSKRTN